MDPLNVLSDETRREIIRLLSVNKSMAPHQLKAHFKISGAAISQHLKVLKQYGFVYHSRLGNRHSYRLNPHTVAKAEHWLAGIIKQWEAGHGPLKSVWKGAKI
jgi:predicted transcriptional regulator